AALLAAETGRSRAALRELAGHERLRRALLLASPALDAQLDAYRRTAPADGARPGKKERKIERSLLSYVYRTACKTSPFSTFTGVALGTLTGSDGLRLRVDEEWRAQARLNVVALGRLADAVIADPARRADLPVAPASGWGRDDDRVRYVRRWVTAGDDDTAVTFDAVKDRLFFLRRSGTLDRLLGLFEERRGSVLRYGELVEWLARDRGAAREECEQYLGALLDVGMVQVPCLRTEVHDTDPLRAFQGALGGLERPWADRLADRLEGPARCVERFADASLEERRVLLDTLRAQLRAVQEEELGAERAKVPQTLLYEDAAAGGSGGSGGSGGASAGVRTELDPAAWAELAAGPLAAVERVLPAFDLTLPQRITFEGFFLARYGHGGRSDDLLKL
ncbi:lantibiotic dehydratase, partial [Streptomyces rubiginosohelvolus]|uniref:lantibiotic dehydratase n=1 Tax=Streptomyces rubiginosohelvolus TaxID=67362 RepID=UPI0033FB36E0